MRASVIIAAHNEGELLAKTIQSCLESGPSLDFEIVVADDHSTDGSVDRAAHDFPQVRVVQHEKRQGPSATKALGANAAHGQVFVFLDGHTKPEPGAIDLLVEHVENCGGQAVITPKVPVLDVHGWKNDFTQVGSGYGHDLLTFESSWVPEIRMKPVHEKGRRYLESPSLIGCGLAVDRNLYQQVWGFDRGMRSWGVEDLDFGLKCWLMGKRILHAPDAVVGHRFRRTFNNYSVPYEGRAVQQAPHGARPSAHPPGLYGWITSRRKAASDERPSTRKGCGPMSGICSSRTERAWSRSGLTCNPAACATSFGSLIGSDCRGLGCRSSSLPCRCR